MNPAAPSEARARLDAIVKAYDVRGIVGEGLTEQSVEALAAGFVDEVGAAGGRVVVGHDMRDSSPGFAAAFARGATRRGADVVAIGLCSTDETYFASGLDAAPRRPCSPRATTRPPTTASSSRARAPRASRSTPASPPSATARATTSTQGITDAATPGTVDDTSTCSPTTRRTCARSSTSRGIRPLKVVVDAGNGMGGLTVPAVLGEAAGPPGAAARDRAALLRARRHLPQPRGEPARAREPRRPAARRRRARRRPRSRLRRRRRSLLRRRRAGRRGQPVGGRRHRRPARDRARRAPPAKTDDRGASTTSSPRGSCPRRSRRPARRRCAPASATRSSRTA